MLMKATAFKQLQRLSQQQSTIALLFSCQRQFSQMAQKSGHEKTHIGNVMDPKFYENDFVLGKTEEMEFVRSPFYDLAKKEKLNAAQAAELID
jgi:hypothetical protein